MNTLGTIFAAILIVISAIVVVVFAMPRIDRALSIRALEICGNISKFNATPDENSNVSYPVKDVYEECLAKAGI